MEEQPISTDAAVHKIEQAKYGAPDGLASGRPTKPRPGVKARKGPPCHNSVVASHYAVDSNMQVPNVATEISYVG